MRKKRPKDRKEEEGLGKRGGESEREIARKRKKLCERKERGSGGVR